MGSFFFTYLLIYLVSYFVFCFSTLYPNIVIPWEQLISIFQRINLFYFLLQIFLRLPIWRDFKAAFYRRCGDVVGDSSHCRFPFSVTFFSSVSSGYEDCTWVYITSIRCFLYTKFNAILKDYGRPKNKVSIEQTSP